MNHHQNLCTNHAERNGVSRRDLLTAGVGLLAAGGFARASRAATPAVQSARTGRARNVIFLVSDGMSMGTFTLADMAIRRRTGEPSAWVDLWGRDGVRRGMMSTRAADSLVTDSAAGGSAWGCGRRLNNGEICWHDGESFEPVLVAARRAGKATGVVSTARVTHATPASFYANVPSRNMEDEIALQLLDRGVDLALGGGAQYLTPDRVAASGSDALLVTDAASLRDAAAHQGRLFGAFRNGHMSYELDRANTPGTTEPTLAEMSTVAIERLARNPQGFVLQIEAGRVDHGGHANDFPACLHDQIAFDETIAVVTAWAAERDDTLVIITTDHGTGGPDLTVYKDQSLDGFDTLLGVRHTLSWIAERLGESARDAWPATLVSLVRDHCGVELADDEAAWALRPFNGERVSGFNAANSPVAALGAVMANHFGVGFVSTNHTAEHVLVTALGPGAQALPTMLENYELHGLMTAALALA